MLLSLGRCVTLQLAPAAVLLVRRSTRWQVRFQSGEQIRRVFLDVPPNLNQPFTHHGDGFAPLKLSFESVGVRPQVAAACRAAFPKIKHPTAMQSRLIEAVLSGDDVLLRDDTGTGKTFALVLALLSQLRSTAAPARRTSEAPKLKITSLFIVPHAALAVQICDWIQRMHTTVGSTHHDALEQQDGGDTDDFSSVCQVLVRSASSPPERQAALLRSQPPHVLVATPTALQDVRGMDAGALQLETLRTVVVDEADEVLPAVPVLKDKKAMKNIRKRLEKHPAPALRLLEIIYASRIAANSDPAQAGGPKRHGSDPQLIVLSATLTTSLKRYLYGEKGLLRRGNLQKIFGIGLKDDEMLDNENHGGELRNADIIHCALIVSPDGTVQNIPGAIPAEEHSSIPSSDLFTPEFDSRMIEFPTEGEAQEIFINEASHPKPMTPSQFDPAILETIAASLAMDVPTAAILILPPSAPVTRAVLELRELGVNAQALGLAKSSHVADNKLKTAEPMLLVATVATMRGMDLPGLTHVFLAGFSHLRHVDYLHAAGRVGRFGQRGKVVCILEAGTSGGGSASQRSTLERIYKRFNITPTIFEHFGWRKEKEG